MKRVSLLLLSAALLVLLAVVAPAGAAAGKRPAAAELTECDTSLDPAERHMVAEGRMGAVSGAAKLRIRFGLQVRTPERPRWTEVEGEKLGVWMTVSPAPRRRYVYAKRIENLAAPADYRMVVRFKWIGANGRKLASAKRTTETCEEPDLRPDLTPDRVTLAPGADPGWARYVVPVRNAGKTAAGPFAVTVAVAGEILRAEVPDGLDAGETIELEIPGPRCEPGAPIQVTVDPDGRVDDADEVDDSLVRACP
ncbi:MAG TPA: CARDB domain-containing protein [Solirubrobacteraceae bacterium]